MRRALLTLGVIVSIAGAVAAVFWSSLVGGDALWPVAWLFWAPVGYTILLRRPGNAVGSALYFVGTTMGVSFALLVVAVSRIPSDISVWAELGNMVLGVPPWLGVIWLLLVFPSGRYEGKWEGVLGRALIAFGVFAAAMFALSPDPMYETGVPSPLAIDQIGWLASAITSEVGFLFVIGFLVVAVSLLVTRWRRSDGMRRAQFRWLFFGSVLFLAVLTAGQFLPDDAGALYLWLPAGIAIPFSIGVAVLRYRLFEIDRIISRTVAYALVVALLGGIFFGLVTTLTTFLSPDDPLVIAVATLAVAALFNPLRKTIQKTVDRRFNRSHYDAERVIEEFTGSLRNEVDADVLVDGWVGVVSDTMQPTAIRVWVREG